MSLLIVDGEVAFLPASPARQGPAHDYLLVHESSLLVSLVHLFETTWAAATPFPGEEGAGGLVDADPWAEELSERDKVLLSLLASGMNDAAIARSLGVGVRTVVRRLTRLMTLLDTQTRFQTGIEASRRGWI